ncbi:MAG: hypothetical protein HDR88_12755 [Bacteroides sp.]|nr:hypothetical protein [Bacteroides sp.]
MSILISMPILAYSQEYTSVSEIRTLAPTFIETMGEFTGVITPGQPLVAELNLGNDVGPEFMESMHSNLNQWKFDFIGYLYTKGEILNSLARIAYNAGIPFAMHFYADCDPTGVIIELSPDDLEASFTRDLDFVKKYIEKTYYPN